MVSQAYLIQFIINWPDIRILLSCATGDQVEKVVRAVKGVFQYNENFRDLFPEFCPAKADDFGSSQQFTVPARELVRGEPTLFCVTVGKTIAGYHPDVIFHSDLVDKENVKTPGGINDVHDHFKYMNPLLERYSARDGYPATRGYTFVEGTPYDFGDLHNTLIENPEWKCRAIRSAQDENGNILWPARFPQEELDRLRREMGDWLFSAQYLMKVVPQGDGLCDPRDIVFIPREHFIQMVSGFRKHVTIDLAGMEEKSRGDWTVLTLGGFNNNGILHIIEIHCGHYTPEKVIEIIFDLHDRWPSIIDFKIEKDAHARVLLPFLQRANAKRGDLTGKWLPPFIQIKRDTHKSKQDRIKGLRPWFKANPPIIRFNGGIAVEARDELRIEVGRFPSNAAGVHDDILDTLADLMQNEEGQVTSDVIADPVDVKFAPFGVARPRDRFLGFNSEDGAPEWLYGDDSLRSRVSKTGFLE